MSGAFSVVPFPFKDVQNIPLCLRNLADQIEAGKYGVAQNLAWVINTGGGAVEVGILGSVSEVAPTLYFLLGMGMRKVEI